MLPTRPCNGPSKALGDTVFSNDDNQMVTYTELNSSSFSSNTTNIDANGIPKIKVEDISYQMDCSSMHWQRSDNCFQPNQFMANNDVHSSLDSRAQTNCYPEPMSTALPCGSSNPVYTDLSNHYPTAANSYQMLYSPNSMPQQNGINQISHNYHNPCPGGEILSNSSQITPITTTMSGHPFNANVNVSSTGESTTDCVQTLTPTVMSALNDSSNLKNIQFMKTIEFLRATDLLNLTLQTAELIKKNLEIQKEINNTKQLLSRFVTT